MLFNCFTNWFFFWINSFKPLISAGHEGICFWANSLANCWGFSDWRISLIKDCNPVTPKSAINLNITGRRIPVIWFKIFFEKIEMKSLSNLSVIFFFWASESWEIPKVSSFRLCLIEVNSINPKLVLYVLSSLNGVIIFVV